MLNKLLRSRSLGVAFQLIRRISPKLRKQRKLILLSVLFMIAEIGISLGTPWPLKIIFDHVIQVKSTGEPASASIISDLDATQLLMLAAAGIILVALLESVAAFVNNVAIALAGSRVLTELRGELYRHLQSLSVAFHYRSKGGDILNRLVGDISRLEEIAITAILPLAIHLLTLVGMLLLMFVLNWRLALIAVTAIPVFVLTTLKLSRRIQDTARDQRERESKMASLAAEALGAMKIVQALSLESKFEGMFQTQNTRNLREGAKGKKLSALLEGSVNVIIASSTAFVVFFGTNMVLRGELSPGDLLVFMAYLKSGLKPMQDLAKYAGRIAKATASAERVLEILDTVPEISDRVGAIVAPDFKGAIRFEQVSFGYNADHIVLSGLDLDVKPGQQVALVGSSGAGKSTLVALLLRLFDVTHGRILVDGRDIRDFTLNSLRKQIAIVLQDSILFGVSVRDNIAYGKDDATLAEIEAAARLANAHDFISALPQGYDTILGERGTTLSGGERQRIAIARAAIRNSPIVILDEPTTGLDKKNEKDVVEALGRLVKGKTTITIAHNLHTIESADTILYVDKGRVIERGRHQELLQRNGAYAKLYGAQSRWPQPKRQLVSPPKVKSSQERHMISSADHALIQRDPVLPGLRILLDTDKLADILRSRLPNIPIQQLKTSYVKYKPGTNCLVGYRLITDIGEIDVYAKAFHTADSNKLSKEIESYRQKSVFRATPIVIADVAVIIHVFPYDRKLDVLSVLANKNRRDELLKELIPGISDFRHVQMGRLRYKPERRFVGYIRDELGKDAIIKAYSPSEYAASLNANQVFCDQGPLKIAPLLGHSDKHHVLAFEWVENQPLEEMINRPNMDMSVIDRVGAALAELHSQNPSGLDLISRDTEIRTLVSTAQGIVTVCPEVNQQVSELTAKISSKLVDAPRMTQPIHGDFKADQVLCTKKDVVVIDFDQAARGDPATDIGSFISQLEQLAIRGVISHSRVEDVRDRLIESYRETAGAVPENINLYSAMGLIRLAPHEFRSRANNWPERTSAILDRASELLQHA